MCALWLAILKTISLVLDIYFKVVIVEIAVHWLLHFKIIDVQNKYAEKFVEILKKITEPVYERIRSKIKPIADFDVAPFVLLLALYFVGQFLGAMAGSCI